MISGRFVSSAKTDVTDVVEKNIKNKMVDRKYRMLLLIC